MAKTEPTYFLGIESTGRTVALLSDNRGEVLGRGTAGPSVYSLVGKESSGQALWTAIVAAFASAGYNTRVLEAGAVLPEIAVSCVAMSGIERPKDEAAVRRIFANFNLGPKVVVTSEAHAVVLAGIDDGYGLAILGGESGLAFALSSTGKSARASGWGHLLGDEGSAHHLGLMAVRRVLEAVDGRGPETELTAQVFQEWKLPADRPDLLASRVYKLATGPGTGGNKAQIEETIEGYKKALAALAPLVERAATRGDIIAREILDESAEELARAVRATVRLSGLNTPFSPPPGPGSPANAIFNLAARAGIVGGPQAPANQKIPLALYGSLIGSPYGELRRRVQESLPECEEGIIVTEPAEGALRLALAGAVEN